MTNQTNPLTAVPSKRRPKLAVAVLLALVLLAAIGTAVGWYVTHRGTAAATPTPPATAPASTPAGALTPPPSLEELAEKYPELADLLTNSKLDSVYKDLLLAYQEGGIEGARAFAKQRGMLDDQDRIRLILVLDTTDSAPLVAQLKAAGVEVENSYEELVSVAIPLTRVEEVAASGDPGAVFRPLTELEHVIEIRLPKSYTPTQGPVVGEGVARIGAGEWHLAGHTGRGVKVAIFDGGQDGGFQGYESLLGSELPARVTRRTFGSESPGVHGTACAEIVHEVAPDAELYLVSFYDEVDWRQAVDWMIGEGVDVISYSMGSSFGPRDGTGSDARRVDRAREAGVLWVSAMGNEAESHYSGLFSDSDGNALHEFAPGTELLALDATRTGWCGVELQWDDWPASDQDLDLFVLDADGNLLGRSVDCQDGSQSPYESVEVGLATPGYCYVYVQSAGVTGEVRLEMFAYGGDFGLAVPAGSICSPADSRGAFAVGAVQWWSDELASYSSQGPTGDGRVKPDISAPTNVSNVTYEAYGGFSGTSAATPHVAGAAALVLSAFPGFAPDDVQVYLQAQAIDLGAAGLDNQFGWGRLAMGAVPAEGEPTAVLPTQAPPTPIPPTQVPPTAVPPTQALPTGIPPVVVPTQAPPVRVEPTLPPPTAAPTPRRSGGGSKGLLPACAGVLVVIGLCVLGLWLWARRSGGLGVGLSKLRARLFPRPGVAPQVPPAPVQAPLCMRCGQPQRPGARFCLRCGAPLAAATRSCPYCHNQVRAQAQFCARCGRRL